MPWKFPTLSCLSHRPPLRSSLVGFSCSWASIWRRLAKELHIYIYIYSLSKKFFLHVLWQSGNILAASIGSLRPMLGAGWEGGTRWAALIRQPWVAASPTAVVHDGDPEPLLTRGQAEAKLPPPALVLAGRFHHCANILAIGDNGKGNAEKSSLCGIL